MPPGDPSLKTPPSWKFANPYACALAVGSAAWSCWKNVALWMDCTFT